MTHLKQSILTRLVLILFFTLHSSLFTLLPLGGGWEGACAQTMPNLLRTMPDSIIPLLSHNDRLDFLDYAAAGTNAELTNRLSGKSKLLTLTDDFAHWQLTTHSDLQLKLLPHDNGHIVCLVVDSLPDSHLRFYTTDWEPLPASTFFSSSLPLGGFCPPMTGEPKGVQRPLTGGGFSTLHASHFTLSPDHTDLILTTHRFTLPFEGEQPVPPTISTTRFIWKDSQFQQQ